MKKKIKMLKGWYAGSGYAKVLFSGMLVFVLFTGMSILPVCANSGPCGEYDYSELKDMSEQELLNTYCKELETTQIYMMASLFSRSMSIERDNQSCFSTVDKIERVYLKKVKNPLNHEQLLDKCESINKANKILNQK